MSASALIARFGRTFTVTRFAAGTNSRGYYVPATAIPATFDVEMSIQPMTGKELLNLPEGQRTRAHRKGYCATELFTANKDAGIRADLVNVDGRMFEVQNVEFWESDINIIDPYWKVVLAEVNT